MAKAFELSTFAAKLRGKRAERDMTQTDLSRISGVSLFSIINYEGAKNTPTLGKAVAIADALGVTLDDLYPMG